MPENQVKLPIVSLLIAARNEELHILRCLLSVAALEYPLHLLEVLVGNDNSADHTESIVSSFIADKPQFRLISIVQAPNGANLRGKANVLAQLASQANGSFLFFTDADIELQPNWVYNLLAAFKPGIGVVTGVTAISGGSLFARLQSLDWVTATAGIACVSGMGLPVTAIGNNMAFRAEAYHAAGGYQALPFSVTEDHALFMAVVNKGYGFVNLFGPKALAFSAPQPSLSGWFAQRKRWLYGALKVAFPLRMLFFLQFLWYPTCLAVFFTNPALGLKWAMYRYVFVTGFAMVSMFRLKQYKLLLPAILYEPLFFGLYLPLLMGYYRNRDIIWKGRKYSSRNEI